jgi:hypothetical protein
MVLTTTPATGSDGSYSWTAPSTYPPAADYAFEIVQGSDVNYSGLNSYTGGTAAVSSAAAPPSYSASSAGWASASSVPQSAAPTWAPSSHYNGTNATSTSWTMKPTPSTVMTTSALPPATKPSTAPANMGSTLQSPLALIFGAIAAMIYLQ